MKKILLAGSVLILVFSIFSYVVPQAFAQTVSSLSPSVGTTVGGDAVTITGFDFTGATAVNFGINAATNISVASDTSITATSPAGTGMVDVTVTTASGTSAVSSADQFTYTAPPAPSLTSATITSNGTSIGTLSGATLPTNDAGSCNGTNAGTADCHLLNVSNVTSTNGPLPSSSYGFALQANSTEQVALTAYFAAKGWSSTSTNPTYVAYANQINSEIAGTAPFFSFVSDGNGNYSLADGFQKGLGNPSNQPLVIDDNYPAGIYIFTGAIGGNTVTVMLTVTKPVVPPGGGADPLPVDLLSIATNNFVVLSQTGITDTGSHTSMITGNIGSSPITAAAMNDVFCSEMIGKIYGVDAAYVGSGNQTCSAGNPPSSANKTLVDNAVGDMNTAYTNAQGRTNPTATELGAGNIGGMTLAPGLYKWSTDVTIPTDVTLSGGPNDVWIFQIAGNLNIASAGSVPAGVKVILAGGAQASNVFWQVGGVTGATLGTYSTLNGTILSAKQIIIQTGAVLDGRALAQTEVTLASNAVTINSSATSTSVSSSFAGLSITKTANVSTTTPSTSGATSTVVYTLAVAALGPATSTNVTATDTLPADIEFVTSTASVGTTTYASGARSFVWTIGDMASGTVVTASVTTIIDSNASGSIVNWATVSESASSTNTNWIDSASSTIMVQAASTMPTTPATSTCSSNCGSNNAGGSTASGGGGTSTGGGGSAYDIAIDGDAPTTVTASVTLSLYGTGAYTMELSNSSDFSSSTWIPYATVLPWTLALGDGEQAVHVNYRNVQGEAIGSANASIDLVAGTVPALPNAGGQVLGASTSNVSTGGAAATCGVYLNDYIRSGWNNDPAEVTKLQTFLNGNLGTNVPVTGIYDQQDFSAVEQFQIKYGSQVLAPWVSFGLPDQTTPTGFVYQTTKWRINNLYCATLNLPMPSLQVYQG